MEQKQELALVKFGIDPDKIIHEGGRYWMAAEELGAALGFKNPRRSVMNLYNRHKKELRPFSGVTKLMTPGGIQESTIFNTGGQFRIAFFANTPKAEKFRTFVVGMLEALERQEFIHVSQIEHWKKELIELKIGKQIRNSKVMDWDKYNRMIRYRGMGLTQRETAKLLDVSRDAIQHFERIARQYELKLVSGGAA